LLGEVTASTEVLTTLVAVEVPKTNPPSVASIRGFASTPSFSLDWRSGEEPELFGLAFPPLNVSFVES
jgi:hypothetical protein